MLKQFIGNEIGRGFAQAAFVAIVAFAVAMYARWRGVRLVREAAIALSRGFGQIVVVGLVLVVLLKGPWWTSPFLLLAMIGAAGRTSVRRSHFPGALRISLAGIGAGAGSVIIVMTVAGVIGHTVEALIPIGSMLIANAMNANALALERFRAEIDSHRGEIEAGLALGAAPDATVSSYARNALQAGLIPPVNNLRSLGIVWIPGVMTGMLLSGAPPLYASIYQFVVLGMIFASAGLTCVISTRLMSSHAFSPAGQLVLRASAQPQH
jgi:putative ABC transport system permease protein